MATDWSEEAKAKRSASAKKAAETRKANQKRKACETTIKNWGLKPMQVYSYYQNSRVARWALSGVSIIAMMRAARHVRWARRTDLTLNPY